MLGLSSSIYRKVFCLQLAAPKMPECSPNHLNSFGFVLLGVWCFCSVFFALSRSHSLILVLSRSFSVSLTLSLSLLLVLSLLLILALSSPLPFSHTISHFIELKARLFSLPLAHARHIIQCLLSILIRLLWWRCLQLMIYNIVCAQNNNIIIEKHFASRSSSVMHSKYSTETILHWKCGLASTKIFQNLRLPCKLHLHPMNITLVQLRRLRVSYADGISLYLHLHSGSCVRPSLAPFPS